MNLRSVRMSLALVLVLALYLVSFFEPAILFRQVASGANGVLVPAGHVVKLGRQLALSGLLGPLFGNFAVLANPLLLAGCALMWVRRTRVAVTCLGLAVLFALETFQLMLMPYHEDEGGVLLSYMVHPLTGWYCWFGAMVLALLLSLEQAWALRRRHAPR